MTIYAVAYLIALILAIAGAFITTPHNFKLIAASAGVIAAALLAQGLVK